MNFGDDALARDALAELEQVFFEMGLLLLEVLFFGLGKVPEKRRGERPALRA